MKYSKIIKFKKYLLQIKVDYENEIIAKVYYKIFKIVRIIQ